MKSPIKHILLRKHKTYTENLDPNYEDECIKKLLNQKFIIAKEEYERFGESIKNFSNSLYSVSRNTI
jgi:hypothetical protein